MPPPSAGVPPAPRRWATAGAIAWALLFAVLHAAWAAGSRVLISDAGAADEAFGQPWFRTYNAVVVVASVAAAGMVVAAGRVRSARGRRWTRWLLWLTAGLLLVRGGIGGAQFVTVFVTEPSADLARRWSMDGLMLVGGLLFAAAAAGTHREGLGGLASSAAR